MYVSKKKLSELLGVTVGTIDGWKHRKLKRGTHFIVIGHTTLLHLERILDWMDSHLDDYEHNQKKEPKPTTGERVHV